MSARATRKPKAVAVRTVEVDSLRRGLDILRCFRSGRKSMTLADIAGQTDIPRLTAQKLLKTLVAHRFLRYLPELDRYEPDVSCFLVGHALRESLPVIRGARPLMWELAKKFAIDVALASREGAEMMIFETCAGGGHAGELGVGATMPLSSSAAGRAWLWAQRPQLQGEFIERFSADETNRRAIPGIYRAFQDLAERGCCFSLDESMHGSHSIAAPLPLGEGREVWVLAAMAAGPGSKEPFLRDSVAPALLETAAAIRREISKAEKA